MHCIAIYVCRIHIEGPYRLDTVIWLPQHVIAERVEAAEGRAHGSVLVPYVTQALGQHLLLDE